MTIRIICMCALIFHSLSLSGQIVNIEQKRLGIDSLGWYGDVFASMAIQKTTKSFLNINFGGHISNKFGKSKLLLIGQLGLVRAEGEDFSNDGFLHLRHTLTTSKIVSWESFTQLQYNTLTKIDNRWLTGTGPRFKLTDSDKAVLFWSFIYMFEREKLKDPSKLNQDHRISTYLTFNFIPKKTISFNSTTYVQPRIDLWSDYRIHTENTLQFGITDKLSLTIGFQMSYDRFPPPEVPGLTYDMQNGLTYKFR